MQFWSLRSTGSLNPQGSSHDISLDSLQGELGSQSWTCKEIKELPFYSSQE